MSRQELNETLHRVAAETFEALFPFVFLATQDEPLGSVQRYLEQVMTAIAGMLPEAYRGYYRDAVAQDCQRESEKVL